MESCRAASRRAQRVAGGLLLAGTLLCLAHGATAQSYTSTISFQWTGPAPDRIVENHPTIGARIVHPVQNPQAWQTPHSEATPLSRIYLHYANDRYLLPHRTYRGAPTVTILLRRPDLGCSKPSIDRIEASLGQSVDEQLPAMMAAGVLLGWPTASCPPSSRNRLSDLYYRLNCQLSGRVAYIGYLTEAEQLYRTRWAGDAARLALIPQCRANANRTLGYAMSGRLNQFAQSNLFDQAFALGNDIQMLRQDPEWASAFNDYALSNTDVDAWRISGLINEQVEAQTQGDLLRAQSINGQLQALARDSTRIEAFNRAQVDLGRISNDAARINAAIAVRGD